MGCELMPAFYDISADDPDAEQKIIATVRRINSRWIVHGQLREKTTAYLEHLEQNDPSRLVDSCRLTLDLMKKERGVMEDPKALFYSALFSNATLEEIDFYLSQHYLTGAVCSLLRGDFTKLLALPEKTRPLAETLARRIRESRKP